MRGWVGFAAVLLVAVRATTQKCRWNVAAAPGLNSVTSAQLCALMACTRRCPHQCFNIIPPDTILVSAESDGHVLAVWPHAQKECTPSPSARHLKTAPDVDATNTTTPKESYDVIVNAWYAPDDAAHDLATSTHGECVNVRWASRELALLRADCTPLGASALAANPNVVSVRARARVKPHNEFTVAWLEWDSGDPGSSIGWDAHTGLQRWADTLDGRGQVIGHVDTGVDMNSCYFRDPDVSLPPYVSCGSGGALPTSGVPVWLDRRKVIQYVTDGTGNGACGDSLDTDGHGSHTAGTAAGAAACDPSVCASDVARFDGHAPGARLAVFDAGPDSDGFLMLPDDIGGSVLAWAAAAGAYIHTNSWGAPVGGVYGALDYVFDAYAEAHPEALLVVAAGNEGGATGGASARAVTTPGISKNALTVGATVSTPQGGDEAFCGSGSASPSSSLCARLGSSGTEADGPASNVAYFSSGGVLSSGRRVKPDLVAPGYAILSAANEQAAGGVSGTDSTHSAARAGTVRVLAGTSMAAPLVAGMAAGVRQYFTSGFWPCGTPGTGTAWTHVSAALVKATLIALARELTGVQRTASGTAVAHQVGRTSGAGYPNPYQGYGVPQLQLLLRTGSRPHVAPLALPALHTDLLPNGVDAEHAFTTTGESVVYTVCVWAPYAGASVWPVPLRAVLVWTDPALPPLGDTAVTDLVNDLDLAVLDADTSAIVGLGNSEINPALAGSASRTSPTTQPDTTSNVEVVTLRSATVNRTLLVQVTATRIVVAPQRFALVLAGGWGVCNATTVDRCETSGAGVPTPAPTAAPAVPPFDRYLLPGPRYAALSFVGTTRSCIDSSSSVAAATAAVKATGFCNALPDGTQRVEAIVGFATPSTATATVTMRVRSVSAPADVFATPNTYPVDGTRFSWAVRITLMNTDAAGARVYVSLPAIETGSGIVSTRQRLVWRPVTDDPASSVWTPADADADVVASDADRTALVGTYSRVTGSAVQTRDTVWVLQQMPSDGDSATLCSHARFGCTCDYTTAHGYEKPAWRPAVVLLGALLYVCAIGAAAAAVIPRTPSMSPPLSPYTRVETHDADLDVMSGEKHPTEFSAACWLAQGGVLVAASARMETSSAQIVAWTAATCAVCVAGALHLTVLWVSGPISGAGAQTLYAFLAYGIAPVGAACALAVDLMLGSVYADVYVLSATAAACAALGIAGSVGSAHARAVTLIVTSAWVVFVAAHTSRASFVTQSTTAACGVALNALTVVCVTPAHGHVHAPVSEPRDASRIGWMMVTVSAYVLATASYVMVHAPCEP